MIFSENSAASNFATRLFRLRHSRNFNDILAESLIVALLRVMNKLIYLGVNKHFNLVYFLIIPGTHVFSSVPTFFKMHGYHTHV